MKGHPVTGRRVHARSVTGTEVVRCKRAGTWYVEHPPGSGIARRRMGIQAAAALAMTYGRAGGEMFHGLPGGSMFDRLTQTGK